MWNAAARKQVKWVLGILLASCAPILTASAQIRGDLTPADAAFIGTHSYVKCVAGIGWFICVKGEGGEFCELSDYDPLCAVEEEIGNLRSNILPRSGFGVDCFTDPDC